MNTCRRPWLSCAVVVAALVLAACTGGGGGGGGKRDEEGRTRIDLFVASSYSVRRGGAVTLTWQVSDPGTHDMLESPCALSLRPENEEALDPVYVPCSGSRTIWPRTAETSSYMRVQLSALKDPYDEADPYLVEWLDIVMLDEDGPPPDAIVLDLMGDRELERDTREYASGQEVVYQLPTPEWARDGNPVYVELDRDVRLELLPESYQGVLLTSESKASFRRGGTAPTGLQAGDVAYAEPAGLWGSGVLCRGTCVIFQPTDDHYFVRVRNTSDADQTVRVWAYTSFFSDDNEPLNDTFYDAVELEGLVSAGAIETVGDIDLWYAPYTEELAFFTAADGIALELHRLDYDGIVVGGPYQDGDRFEALSGEYLRVRPVDPNEAASSGRSHYKIERVFGSTNGGR